MKLKRIFLTALLAGFSFAAFAADPTALELIKKGNDYVGIQSKDKIVGIHSDKSVGSLTPNIWYVTYYDPDATFKSTEVKFGAGEKMDVKRPFRAIEMATDAHKVLDREKIKVDSDRAIKVATAQPLLKNLTLRATQLWLQGGEAGPEWKVKIWATKVSDTTRDADVGVVILSATDASIVKVDLHPGSAE